MQISYGRSHYYEAYSVEAVEMIVNKEIDRQRQESGLAASLDS